MILLIILKKKKKLLKSIALEKSKKEGIIEGEIKNALISSFELFIDKCDLKFVKKILKKKMSIYILKNISKNIL